MNPTDASATRLTGSVVLKDWGVIRATGADARTFLHGQLTQDVIGLKPGEARLAGLCSPKGRLTASFVIWADADGDLLLACSTDLLAATLKRLSMFVLRAKCKLSDASTELVLMGLAGDAVPALLTWQMAALADGIAIRLPDGDSTARSLWVGPAAAAVPDVPALSLAAWHWLEVMSATPRIVAATVEQFVPQMVNFELVGGVDFKKGCFPGQEIVARSQYRGTLKRRGFIVTSAAALQPGQEVFDAADPDQPAGMVVLAGSRDGDHHAALIELKIAAADGALHVGHASGPALQVAALPYPLPTLQE